MCNAYSPCCIMFRRAKQIIFGFVGAISAPIKMDRPAHLHSLDPETKEVSAAATRDGDLKDPESAPLPMTKASAAATRDGDLKDPESAPLPMTKVGSCIDNGPADIYRPETIAAISADSLQDSETTPLLMTKGDSGPLPMTKGGSCIDVGSADIHHSDSETTPLLTTKGDSSSNDFPAVATCDDNVPDPDSTPLSMTKGAVYQRHKRAMETAEETALRRRKNAERGAIKRKNMTQEQRQQESLKRRAARVQKSQQKSARRQEATVYCRATILGKELGQPKAPELNAASHIIRAALTDFSKDRGPLVPIYTFNVDEGTTRNSIFVKCPSLEIIDGSAVYNWEIDCVGADVPKSFIISPTKTRPFFILCNATEIADIDGVVLVGHGSHAVLLCAAYNCNNSVTLPKPDDIRDDMRTFKENIVKKKPHFGSCGECYSFGDHASFRKVSVSSQSSIHPYSFRDVEKERHYRHILLSLVRSAQNEIDNCLPGFSTVCTLSLDVMLDTLNEKVYIQGIPSPSCSGNYLAAHYNFNAGTSQFHIERDTSYTIMLVPFGCTQNNLQLQFHFRLNDTSMAIIGMTSGVTFTYAAYLLTHRQHCSASDYDCCFNCSAYGNKQLFQHARTTYIRKMSTDRET